ncbi:MAG: TIGR01906 family membrane protein [Tissierellia bacterium]|nr:TIGR01906 family membrane protein [Tissierellia bacterium]
MKKAFIILLIIFLPLYLFLQSIEINAFDKDFYLDSYKKYGVLEVSKKTLEELDGITEDLLSYLRDKSDDSVLERHFNEKEVLHMRDVKILFKYGFVLKNISFVLSLISLGVLCYKGYFKSLGISLFYGPFIWWGGILTIFLLSLSDFNKYFTYFHLVFFDNDLWLLNPKTDLLIQMLPQEFFSSIFKKMILLFLLMLVIIQIIGYVVMRKGKNGSEKARRF